MKQEDEMYSNNEIKISVRQESLDFLWYSYFGITQTKVAANEETIKICARRAYRDLGRTPLAGIGNMDIGKKTNYRNTVNAVIARSISELFGKSLQTLSKENAQSSFDEWHRGASKKIEELTTEHNVPITYTYGIAQKWLNMTLKYMVIMELWKDMLMPIKLFLHVPVDSYIIEAAWEYSEVVIPSDKVARRGKYSSEKVKAWSRWEEKEYFLFQKGLRDTLEKINTSPFDWEFSSWIRIARERADDSENYVDKC